jgi:hypothetical protein
VENSNEKQTIILNNAAYQELQQYFAPSRRSTAHVESTVPVPLREQVVLGQALAKRTDGLQDDGEVEKWQVQRMLDHYRIEQSAIQYQYGDGRNVPEKENAMNKGKKRKLSSDAEPSTSAQKKKPRPRTCVRCRRSDCEAKWGRKECTNKKVNTFL